MARAISKARLRLVLLLSLLIGMVFAGVVPAHAAGTASISGTVTVPAGVDVTQTTVTLLSEGEPMFDSETAPDATGAYTFAGKSPLRYKIMFTNPATTEVWNGGAPTMDTAPWIELADGQQLTGQDVTLAVGGSISGTVTVPADGISADNVIVEAYTDESGDIATVTTGAAADGSYTLEPLLPGDYKVKFKYGLQADPPLWNGGVLSREEAASIAVGSGAAVTGIDASFIQNASISGTVTAGEGNSLDGLRIQIVSSDGSQVAQVEVNSDGTYSATGLRPGTYKASTVPRAAGENWLWYSGATDEASATPIVVGKDQSVSGIDFALPSAGIISGKIIGYSDGDPMVVLVYPATQKDLQDSPGLGLSPVNPDGSYSVPGLPAGSVKVALRAGFAGYADQWYGGTTLSDALSIPVSPGQEVSGIDFTLVPEAVISGQVKSPFVWNDTLVKFFGPDGQQIAWAFPGPDGTYETFGLPAGSYKVQFDSSGGTPSSWFGGKTQGTAAVITVEPGDFVTGVDSDVLITPSPSPSPKPTPTKKPTPKPTSSEKAAVKPAGNVAAANSDPAANGELAQTGTPANLAPLGLAGGVLGAAGVVLLLAARLRARRQETSSR